MMQAGDAGGEEAYRQALSLYRLGRLDEAWMLCEQSLLCQPQSFEALHLSGIIAIETHRPEQAAELIGSALALDPGSASAHNNRGNALLELGRCEAAIGCYDEALSFEPRLADAHYNRGNALFDLQDYGAALASYGRAIECQWDYLAAHNNSGLACLCQRQYTAALEHYDHSIEIDPWHPDAHRYRGDVLRALGSLAAAVDSYDSALACKPDCAEALNGRGIALAGLRQLDAALDSIDRAIALDPELAEAWMNRGNVLGELGRWIEAVSSYDHAIARKPGLAEAHYQRGDAQRRLGRFEAAVASYDRALSITPGLKFLPGTRLHAKMQTCDWRDFDAELAHLSACVERGEAACPPFALLALSGSASLQRSAAEIYVREECRADAGLPAIPARDTGGRIRLGYFSADFRNHPVAHLTAALFEAHDRSAFEVIGFSTGPGSSDDMRRRLEQGFDRFIDGQTLSDRDMAQLGRDLELDIAIDLGGYTSNARPAIFAMRPAALQVGYLGYLGTSAAPHMDYLLADRVLVTPESRPHYSEKMLYLPSYQSNDAQRRMAERAFTRDELGLPSPGFVFCCFNAPYKLTPATFAGWMRILDRVPGSVLLLYAGSPAAELNLRSQALRSGVDARRLVFAEKLPIPEYLARFRCADLFLDTLPYNAGTTASDALWAGLPVLTCAGESFAGRMAASLLTAMNLPELIAPSQARYEALAVELAQDAPRLYALRQRLAEQRLASPLFDIRRFATALEAGYFKICQRQYSGLPPDDIEAE